MTDQLEQTTPKPATIKIFKAEELRIAAKTATINKHAGKVTAMLENIMLSMADEAQIGNYGLSVEFTETEPAVVATLATILGELGYSTLVAPTKIDISWEG